MVNDNFGNHRGNITRKVKGDPNKDPETIIGNFLKYNGDSVLSKILHHVKHENIPYSKQGLIDKLKSMKGKKIIRIIKEKGSHTKYRIIDKPEFQIQSDAFAFKDHICFQTMSLEPNPEELNKMKTYPNNTVKRDIVNTIFNLGIVSFYTLLASYRRGIDPMKSKEENDKLLELWLKNTMSFEHNRGSAKISQKLKSKLVRQMIDKNRKEEEINNQSEQPEEFQKHSTKKLQQEDFIAEAKKFEKTFSKMFPEWYKLFQGCEDMLNKENNKFMRDICFENQEMLLS